MSKVLVSTKGMTKEEWRKWRKVGIGGSDVAAIMGLSKWKSPVGVYLDKVAIMDDKAENESMYWGNTLEDIIAQEFTKRTGLKVKRRNAILQHDDYEWMIANVDRLLVNGKAGLEIKTANAYAYEDWMGDKIPDAYALQCMHYMAVTGIKKWHICCLVGGNTFVHKEIDYDADLVDMIIAAEKDFWVNHVLAKKPPLADGSDASTDALSQLYPVATIEDYLVLGKEEETLLDEREEVAKEIKKLDYRKTTIDNLIKQKMGEFPMAQTDKYIIKWHNVSGEKKFRRFIVAMKKGE